jgi:predicted DNA-binding protein (MmcQ/YjbR family)
VNATQRRAFERLLAHALSYPDAWEDHPWDETVAKVGKKVFVFMGGGPDDFGISVKLPESNEFALGMDFTAPTGYGLGRAGWVTATFPKGSKIPIDLLCDWIDESYRTVAPKKLVKALDEREGLA